jgi:hypothetical protein
LLINFHGNGFIVDGHALNETIPLAGLTGTPVMAVFCSMAPDGFG